MLYSTWYTAKSDAANDSLSQGHEAFAWQKKTNE